MAQKEVEDEVMHTEEKEAMVDEVNSAGVSPQEVKEEREEFNQIYHMAFRG